jgi:acyl-coenzyme A thioesterase PaaI-like protein
MNELPPTWFYDESEAGFVATALAAGPWDKRYQNGVALAGLVAHLAERTPSPVPMVCTRLVIDILRPSPMGVLAAQVTRLREGKRLQLLEIELTAGGERTIRASVLRVRQEATPFAALAVHALAPEGLDSLNGGRSKFAHVVETRVEAGGLEAIGPGVVWVRFFGEIVRGVPISPLVQAAMAADFGSGISTIVDWRDWSFANVDISLHLARAPRGPWVRVAAQTLAAGEGVGVVDAELADSEGVIGRAHQSLFYDRRT